MAKFKAEQRNTISGVRLEEINIFNASLFQFINPNTAENVKRNVIMINNLIRTLGELIAEVEAMDIRLEDICCDRLYGNVEKNSLDEYIRRIGNGFASSVYIKDYIQMKEAEDLEEYFPASERRTRIKALTEGIAKKEAMMERLQKVSPTTAREVEKSINSMKTELKNLEETLKVITREQLNKNIFNMLSNNKSKMLEDLMNNKAYLEGLMK